MSLKQQGKLWVKQIKLICFSHGKTRRETVPYYSEIIYVDQSVYVWNSTESKRLPVGENRFPFSFILPTNCPPTFEGSVGFIRYFIKAKIDR